MSYIRLERFSDFYPGVPLDGSRKRLPEHLLECLGIRMDVRKYRVPHGDIISLLTQEILPVALSRQPVGVVARTAEAVIEVEVI